MQRPQSVEEWSVEMKDVARIIIRKLLNERPEGTWRDLSEKATQGVLDELSLEGDVDCLSDDLYVPDLFEKVLSVCAELDTNGGFGSSYRVFSVLKSMDSEHMVFDDEIETGQYSLICIDENLEDACQTIGESAFSYFGWDSPLSFDGVSVDPTEILEKSKDFWASLLLSEE